MENLKNSVFDSSGSVFDSSGSVFDLGCNVFDSSGTVFDSSGIVFDSSGTVLDSSGTVFDNIDQPNNNSPENIICPINCNILDAVNSHKNQSNEDQSNLDQSDEDQSNEDQSNEDQLTPLDSIRLENENDFNVLVIKPNDIENYDWKDPRYIKKLLQKDIFDIKKINPNSFIENITEFIKMKNYNSNEIITNTICEDSEHIYEIIHLKIVDKDIKYEDLNQFSMLLDINGELIFGYTIILKTHLPKNSTNSYFVDITKDDIGNILDTRVNNTIVIHQDDTWLERRCNNIEEYSEYFFGDDKYRIKKKELGFLRHNINIWYTTFEYAEENVCGKLINEKIDKCIIFSNSSEKYRGNISLNEVKKIIELSNVLEKFEVEEEDVKEENDSIGRNILKTKYRILEKKYNQYFNLNL